MGVKVLKRKVRRSATYVYKGVYRKGDKHDREKCYLQKWYMYIIPFK